MNRHTKHRLSKLIFPVIGMSLLAYFTYHILQGNHGWFAWKTLEKELEKSQKELAQLREDHEALKNKVSLLRPESLDEDMLDERVRTMLGTAKPNEIVVIDDEVG